MEILLFCQNNLLTMLIVILIGGLVLSWFSLYLRLVSSEKNQAKKDKIIEEQLNVQHGLYVELLKKSKYGKTQ